MICAGGQTASRSVGRSDHGSIVIPTCDNAYVETKHCGRCDRTLPVASFSKHRGRPDGLQAYCKDCYRAANRRKDAANKQREVIDTPTEKQCAACGLTLPASAFYSDKRRRDGLYSNCRTCHRKITDGWKTGNREAVTRINRTSARRNATKRAAAQRAYRSANRAAQLAAAARWKSANRARATALEAIRRGRKANASGTATPEQVAARVAYYGGKCWMCGAPWQQIEHVKPLAKGGPNWPANLRPACTPCNLSKGSRWPLAA